MTSFPLILQPEHDQDIDAWINQHAADINARLNEAGAILIRGGARADATVFEQAVAQFCGEALRYIYRSTPRTEMGDNVYTATEYPAGLTIPFHCENAYQRVWPMRLMFYCAVPAEHGGGQTPIADVRRVTARIPPPILEKFRERKIAYVRNYKDGIDLPWQSVFQTDDRTSVDRFCAEHGIEAQWLPDGLRTRQVCHGTARHPTLGMELFFNQAHLFHPSSLDPLTREIMLEMYGENNLPRNATFGDGSPLDETELEIVRRAFEDEEQLFDWELGDILVLDNMLSAHARKPFKGQRKILTAMGRPSDAANTGALS